MNRLTPRVIAAAAIATLLLLETDCMQGRIRRLLKSQKLVGVNLSGRDFYNLNLPGINLTRARLVRTSLSFCSFRGGTFVNADLRQADLSASDFTGADLRGANLRGARCHNALFRGAQLVDAYFYDADLSGADLRDAVMADDLTHGGGGSAGEPPAAGALYVHLRNADLSGAAVSARWKAFILGQGVRNYDRIIWSR